MDDSPWGDVPSSNPHSPPNEQATAPDTDETLIITPPKPTSTPTIATVKTPGGRASRTPRRYGTQPTRLEALDDDLGPLGPLGQSAPTPTEPDEPPALPQKELLIPRGSRPNTAGSSTSKGLGAGQAYDDEDGDSTLQARYPPPVQPQSQDGSRRQTQPSVSVEQAARPTFNVSVGDPHKVGDLTGSHTVYQVRTKTTSKAYRNPEFEVSRRYRDFLWLYNQLHINNPGIVVPPPPEKQAVGRFDSGFVEARRSALERMLNKTAAHLILQHDGDLKLFLESETFTIDVKHRERKDPDFTESKGMFSGLNLSVGSGSKFIEHDDWFLDRRIYLDTLDTNLKGLLRATDTSIAQRRALSEACADLSTSLSTLSQVELSPSLSGPLAALSDLQLRVRDLYSRQAQQDALTLGIVIDEYIRLIGSIRKAFEQRQRSWGLWHTADSDLQKRRAALDRVVRGGRTQQDRIGQLQADVGDAERRAHQAKLTFDDLGKGMRVELERFEKEKVEDFRAGVETFLESSVEAQKELIELWETYLMHLDADEEGQEGQGQAPLPSDQRNPDQAQKQQPVDADPGTEEEGTVGDAGDAVGAPAEAEVET